MTSRSVKYPAHLWFMPAGGGYVLIMNGDVERKDIERDQDDAEREIKGKRQAAANPADQQDPRGERKPPEPFSGATR
jgi:hypothetical protein